MPGTSPGHNAKRNQPKPDEAISWSTHHLSLAELRSLVDSVLVEMVTNRDVSWDAEGKPLVELRSSGDENGCSWCHYDVDFSAIGMPIDTPLVACSYEGDTFIVWHLGRTPFAHTPKGITAKHAAGILNMDVLLSAFLRSVRAEGLFFHPQ